MGFLIQDYLALFGIGVVVLVLIIFSHEINLFVNYIVRGFYKQHQSKYSDTSIHNKEDERETTTSGKDNTSTVA